MTTAATKMIASPVTSALKGVSHWCRKLRSIIWIPNHGSRAYRVGEANTNFPVDKVMYTRQVSRPAAVLSFADVQRGVAMKHLAS